MLPILVSLLLAVSAVPDLPDESMPAYSEEIFVVGNAALVEPVEPGQPIFLVFGVGELDIETSDTGELRAELVADCRELSAEKCARARKKLQIEPRRTARGLEIHMTGLSRRFLRKMGVEGRVILPHDSPLEAQLGIGDVEIHSGIEDLTVRMGIGDLTIHAPESAVGTVSVKTKIGDASVRASGRVESQRRMLIGAKARWSAAERPELEPIPSGPAPRGATPSGPSSSIDAVLKIGDATVILE